jgi:hypothetical protein
MTTEYPLNAGPVIATHEHNDRGMRIADGKLICQNCGGTVRFGWSTASFGPIILATCGRPACMPGKPWVKLVEFKRPKRNRRVRS